MQHRGVFAPGAYRIEGEAGSPSVYSVFEKGLGFVFVNAGFKPLEHQGHGLFGYLSRLYHSLFFLGRFNGS